MSKNTKNRNFDPESIFSTQKRVELSEKKLQELAEDPANLVFHVDPATDGTAVDTTTVAPRIAEVRDLAKQIRARMLVLRAELPSWSIDQIRNRLCRERTDWLEFAQRYGGANTSKFIWQVTTDPDAAIHDLKHVEHLFQVTEREQRGEINAEEAKTLVQYYAMQNLGKPKPKKRVVTATAVVKKSS